MPKRSPVNGSGGYVLVYEPNHPRANASGYVPEHILVMEEKIGHLLEVGEVVHHIDGDRKNNHPDNLMLFSSSGDHTRFHRLEAKRIVRQGLTSVTPQEWGELWLASVGLLFEQCREILCARGYSREVVYQLSRITCKAHYQLLTKQGGSTRSRRNFEITRERFITFAMLKAREF